MNGDTPAWLNIVLFLLVCFFLRDLYASHKAVLAWQLEAVKELSRISTELDILLTRTEER